MKKTVTKCGLYILLLIGFTLLPFKNVWAQIKSINLDLTGTMTNYQTYQGQNNVDMRSYGQYYSLGVNGYAFDPQLMIFNVNTTLSDFSTTNKMNNGTHTMHSRNWGYYNFSSTLFPASQHPFTFYASRSEMEKTSTADTTVPEGFRNKFLVENQTTGFRYNMQRNNYIPQLELMMERNVNNSIQSEKKFNQTNDALSIRLNNSSQDDKTQYSLHYTGTRLFDNQLRRTQVNNEFQYYGNSRLSETMDVYTNGVYGKRDRMSNRMTEMGLNYRQKEDLSHYIKVGNSENHFPTDTLQKSMSTTVIEQTSVTFSRHLNGNFGILWMTQKNTTGNRIENLSRSQIQTQIMYNHKSRFANFTEIVSNQTGFEEYTVTGKKLVQQTQANLVAVSSLRLVQLTLREDIAFQTNYYYGNMLQNTAAFGAMSNVVPRSTVGADVSYTSFKYFDHVLPSPHSTTLLQCNITSRFTSTFQAELRQSFSWTRTAYSERLSVTNVTLSEYGFIRNMMIQARAARTYNTHTKLKTLSVENLINYRFRALLFTARYALRNYGKMRSREVFFEMHRSLAFEFK